MTAQPISRRTLAAAIWLTSALFAGPALADQTLIVEDNGRVDCVASQKDVTRISLIGDEFASVTKMQADNPLDDFGVVNENTRGDIYVSVPAGFRPNRLSFFGTTKKGYVYKFACRLEPVEAQQIFLSNPAAQVAGKAADPDQADQPAPDLDETAVRLIQGMASQKVVPGFRMERTALMPVRSGDVSVQLLAQYQGLDLIGRVLRIENFGKAPVELTDGQLAPTNALAVAIGSARLAPRQITTAYVVTRKPPAGS